MDTPSLRISTTIEHENAMVIACFPSVGMVSSIVAHYLIDHLTWSSLVAWSMTVFLRWP